MSYNHLETIKICLTNVLYWSMCRFSSSFWIFLITKNHSRKSDLLRLVLDRLCNIRTRYLDAMLPRGISPQAHTLHNQITILDDCNIYCIALWFCFYLYYVYMNIYADVKMKYLKFVISDLSCVHIYVCCVWYISFYSLLYVFYISGWRIISSYSSPVSTWSVCKKYINAPVRISVAGSAMTGKLSPVMRHSSWLNASVPAGLTTIYLANA